MASGLRRTKTVWALIVLGLSIWFLVFFLFDQTSSIYNNSMSFSGFLTIIFGIAYSVYIDKGKMEILRRWRDLWILEFDCAKLQKMGSSLRRREIIATTSITTLLVVATFVGYTAFYHWKLTQFHVASLICAALVGLRISRLVAHGLIGSVLRAQDVGVNMIVDHSDGAGGTAQIGKFYLLNATVFLIPSGWLVIWMIKLSWIEEAKTNPMWSAHFVILLAITGIIFLIACWLPLVRFSQMMVKWKSQHVALELAFLKEKYRDLFSAKSGQSDSVEERQLGEVVDRMELLSKVSDWPVSPNSFTKYLSILMIVIPPIVSALFS